MNKKLRWAGEAHIAPFGVLMSQKDGYAQRTGAHAQPKPTSFSIKTKPIRVPRFWRIFPFLAAYMRT
jgi:hypothetical protein